jgi:hypothetical protein
MKENKLMPTLLNRFKILASSLCVVFAGAFSAQAGAADHTAHRSAAPAHRCFRLNISLTPKTRPSRYIH